MKVVLRGASTSGWYSPPKGTHSGERHRTVGSGKVRLTGKKVAERIFSQIPKSNPGVMNRVLIDTRRAIAGAASDENMTAVELEKRAVGNLRDQVENRPICINTPASIAHLILDDGKFKNQHETDTSGGTLSPRMRRDAGMNAFAYDKPPIASDLPVYGYIDDGPKWVIEAGYKVYRASDYGDVTFVLKDTVRARTTITMGDSLWRFDNKRMTGTPLTEPGLEGMDGEWSVAYRGQWGRVPYVEAQVHGGITLGDIDRIIVQHYERGPKAVATCDALGAKAKSLGIKIEYRRV